ncbi:MAG TPA: PrsW family intramembrane metalloprotease [Actinomycetes bacterium]|nr:PrsW family intramembrane metalloprotease [Actinomycetes bacterium]
MAGGASRPGPVTRGLRLPARGPKMSLFQPTEPAFYGYLLLLVVTGILTAMQQGALLVSSPASWLLSWLLLLFYLLPMFLVIYFLDFYEREPLSLVIGALLWGAVAATLLSAVANTTWGAVIARLGGPDFAANWSAALTAPLIEETMKATGVVLIYLIARRELNDIMDGFVYGAMIGLGFAVVEDVYYFVAEFAGGVGGVLVGFFVRVIAAGLYGHVLYTGLAGIGIAYFLTRAKEAGLGRRLLVAAGLCLTAVLAHFLWNSPVLSQLFPGPQTPPLAALVQFPVAMAVKGLPFLVFLALMLRLAHRRELYWLKKSIETELGGPGLYPGELEVLVDPGRRRASRRQMRGSHGPVAATLLKRVQREQIKLAMIRTRVGTQDHPDLARQRGVIQRLRDQLAVAVSPRPPVWPGAQQPPWWPGDQPPRR